MKHFLLLVLVCCFYWNTLPAQIVTGNLKKEDLETFKKTTTVFVLQPSDRDRIKDFEKTIGEVWTITPFKIITTDSEKFYRGQDFSLFQISAGINSHERTPNENWLRRQETEVLLDYKIIPFYYELSIPDYNKKGQLEGRTLIAQFGLFSDYDTINSLIGFSAYDRAKLLPNFEGQKAKEARKLKDLALLYNKARFYNWGPGQIRAYLKDINNQLIEGKKRTILYTSVPDKAGLKALTHDTLYLPNYLKEKINPYIRTADRAADEDASEDAAKAYPFPHRYIDEAELENMIMHATKPVYHMVFVRNPAMKHIAVVEGMSASTLYSIVHHNSYNFKMKDLKKLKEHIE